MRLVARFLIINKTEKVAEAFITFKVTLTHGQNMCIHQDTPEITPPPHLTFFIFVSLFTRNPEHNSFRSLAGYLIMRT